ncbi:MAG: MBOAT family O-acyltransferase [Pseudomonadota bacterium]
MIDAISFLALSLLSIAFSHMIFARDRRSRLFWIVAPGVLLLFITHTLALVFALLSFALSIAVFLAGRAIDRPRATARLPYAILLLLFVPDVFRHLGDNPVLWLGSAFFIVRQMMTVAQGLKNAVSLHEFIPALLISTFFFAALPSGPVFNGLKCWEKLRESQAPDYREGGYRLFEGFVYLFAVAGFSAMAVSVVQEAEIGLGFSGGLLAVLSLTLIAKPLLSFAFLFATFYGYSRMAEGAALLLGFEVPQNFNKPHLARDLGDFWKRWHRSMADFVMQYIYLPLLVTTSRARLALLAAFVFMGLWHDFSLGFLIWGVGHGVGLAYALPWAQRRKLSPITLRIGSLAYVIILSGVAHGVWST